MDFKSLQIRKAKRWQEIKSLKNEFNRNVRTIKDLQDRQVQIYFETKEKISLNEKESNEYTDYCFKNNEGEFK